MLGKVAIEFVKFVKLKPYILIHNYFVYNMHIRFNFVFISVKLHIYVLYFLCIESFI